MALVHPTALTAAIERGDHHMRTSAEIRDQLDLERAAHERTRSKLRDQVRITRGLMLMLVAATMLAVVLAVRGPWW